MRGNERSLLERLIRLQAKVAKVNTLTLKCVENITTQAQEHIIKQLLLFTVCFQMIVVSFFLHFTASQLFGISYYFAPQTASAVSSVHHVQPSPAVWPWTHLRADGTFTRGLNGSGPHYTILAQPLGLHHLSRLNSILLSLSLSLFFPPVLQHHTVFMWHVPDCLWFLLRHRIFCKASSPHQRVHMSCLQ